MQAAYESLSEELKDPRNLFDSTVAVFPFKVNVPPRWGVILVFGLDEVEVSEFTW